MRKISTYVYAACLMFGPLVLFGLLVWNTELRLHPGAVDGLAVTLGPEWSAADQRHLVVVDGKVHRVLGASLYVAGHQPRLTVQHKPGSRWLASNRLTLSGEYLKSSGAAIVGPGDPRHRHLDDKFSAGIS